LRIPQITANESKESSRQFAMADQPQGWGQEEHKTMGKTYTKPGKTGQITYVVNFYNGHPIRALSFFTREDGLGGTQEVIRRLDPDGPTIRKLMEKQQ
jgi:hypothetical protein